MTKLAFWDKPEVRELLKKIETSQGCLKYRWGDHVLIGSALNLYAPNQFSIIKNIEYFHQSHNNIIKIGETEEKSWMS
jgi:LEA14-like dessication related protein